MAAGDAGILTEAPWLSSARLCKFTSPAPARLRQALVSPEPLQLVLRVESYEREGKKSNFSFNMSKTAHPKHPKETSGREEVHIEAPQRA